MNEKKQWLRRAVRNAENQLSLAYRTEADRTIAAHLLAIPAYQAAKTVFCFVSTGLEIDTRPILTRTLADGKLLCVPLCVGAGIMELRQITDLNQLSPGAYGIPEPPGDSPQLSPVDLAVLPCAACDRFGRRLGRGGGYYDRFLARYQGAALLLCREHLLQPEIPVEPWDIPVPWVLTEKGLYRDGMPVPLDTMGKKRQDSGNSSRISG